MTFGFGEGENPIRGVIQIRITLPGGQHIAVDVHVVSADIPLLIFMEVLCAQCLIMGFGRAIITQ